MTDSTAMAFNVWPKISGGLVRFEAVSDDELSMSGKARLVGGNDPAAAHPTSLSRYLGSFMIKRAARNPSLLLRFYRHIGRNFLEEVFQDQSILFDRVAQPRGQNPRAAKRTKSFGVGLIP
jgi:hypothetical protein